MSERYLGFVAGARVAGPAAAIGFFLGLYLYVEQRLSGWGLFGVMLLGGALGFGLGVLVYLGSRSAGKQLANLLTAAGNLPPAPSFSYQEALVARGRLDEARESYEAHLRDTPADQHARLALARLWRDELRQPEKAEQLYLEARRYGTSSEQEFAIGNALIDLYHARGERGREIAELARFAERFAGTDAGKRAREALLRLKSDPAPD